MTDAVPDRATQHPSLSRLWAAYGRGSALLWQTAPDAHIDIGPHASLTLSGEPSIEMNWGVVDAGGDAPDLLRGFAATIRERRLDAYLMATSAAAPVLEPVAGDLGLAFEGASPLMVRRRTHERAFVIEQETITVERVTDEWALDDVSATLTSAFSTPAGAIQRAFAPTMLSIPGLDVFVLRFSGEAAGAVVTTRIDDLVGFWAMGTVPELRRRHLGRRLLEAVIDHHGHLADPPDWFVLVASSMGRPLYETLGFAVVDEARNMDVLAAPPASA